LSTAASDSIARCGIKRRRPFIRLPGGPVKADVRPHAGARRRRWAGGLDADADGRDGRRRRGEAWRRLLGIQRAGDIGATIRSCGELFRGGRRRCVRLCRFAAPAANWSASAARRRARWRPPGLVRARFEPRGESEVVSCVQCGVGEIAGRRIGRRKRRPDTKPLGVEFELGRGPFSLDPAQVVQGRTRSAKARSSPGTFDVSAGKRGGGRRIAPSRSISAAFTRHSSRAGILLIRSRTHRASRPRYALRSDLRVELGRSNREALEPERSRRRARRHATIVGARAAAGGFEPRRYNGVRFPPSRPLGGARGQTPADRTAAERPLARTLGSRPDERIRRVVTGSGAASAKDGSP